MALQPKSNNLPEFQQEATATSGSGQEPVLLPGYENAVQHEKHEILKGQVALAETAEEEKKQGRTPQKDDQQ